MCVCACVFTSHLCVSCWFLFWDIVSRCNPGWCLTGNCPVSACREWDSSREWDCRCEPLYRTFSLFSLSSPWTWCCWLGQFFLISFTYFVFQQCIIQRFLFPFTLKPECLAHGFLSRSSWYKNVWWRENFCQEVERKPLNNVIMSWIPQGVNLLITFQLSWSNCFWKHHRYTQRCAPRIPCVVFDVIKVTELTLTGSWTFLCPGNGSGTLLCFRHYTVENLIPKGALCIVHCKQKLIAAPQIFGCL